MLLQYQSFQARESCQTRGARGEACRRILHPARSDGREDSFWDQLEVVLAAGCKDLFRVRNAQRELAAALGVPLKLKFVTHDQKQRVDTVLCEMILNHFAKFVNLITVRSENSKCR